ncbi:MAG: ferredoxin, partial [Chloroflexi bacterium]
MVFQPNGRQGTVAVGANLLEAARRLGVEIESICGGHQTCGKCKVLVEEGEFAKYGLHSNAGHLSPPEAREHDYAAQHGFAAGARLSCACQVTGDLVIRVPEESQVRKQVVRKGPGGARPVTADAAMRLFYVELPPAELRDHRGDWERLQAELERVHGLQGLRIDLPALRSLQPALAAAKRAVTVTVYDRREVVRVQPGFDDAIYGLAVDVGTTTVAGHLC